MEIENESFTRRFYGKMKEYCGGCMIITVVLVLMPITFLITYILCLVPIGCFNFFVFINKFFVKDEEIIEIETPIYPEHISIQITENPLHTVK